MRRKRSDELPRYRGDDGPLPFQWRRRYWGYLTGIFVICWILYPRRTTTNDGSTLHINWSKYAYSLYATDSATLCHAVMVFEALARLGSKADRVLFYPNYWDTVVHSATDRDSQLLVIARDRYNVKLVPIKLLNVEGRTTDAWVNTWDKSVTKFMAFSLTYYDRVIAMDSDVTLLASLDELFLLPQTPMAMPRAYWYPTKPWPLTSMLMVIKPNQAEFGRFKNIISGGGNPALVNAHKFDMELINDRFEHSALVLPHRPYALLTGEFRNHDHSLYLGNTFEEWSAEKALKEAKLVHFSDWPLPKPWIMWPLQGLAEVQPDCNGSHEGTCEDRKVWKGLYEDFRQRRKDICRLLSVPAPEWHTIKDGEEHVNATEGTGHEAPHLDDASAAGTLTKQE
ncbi:glucose N-acetyltransferase 1 [Massarina eburnea CBS 473.64]|uniref:Glucose N-acetyltransferase 1 n=1 Tax=Massarina eburnea CBS 473.64 TaxID=1395130 RepID=A0A6A6S4X3_9PLEO|nr:glucose N-acetyltransferase 1 [Massarina eburnea CBS 473.64]